MKPFIGVIPLYDDERQSLWMYPGYMEIIRLAGGIPLMLPIECGTDIDALYSRFDGFLFTGGHDVSPHIYGEQTMEVCGGICAERDALESEIFERAYRDDKPIFGICRGIQLINALTGGTLYQDLPTQYQSGVNHVMKAPYDRVQHTVRIERGTLLADVFGAGDTGVNSYHHQAVKTVGSETEIAAYSEDGLAEALRIKTRRFIYAVQWHPEFSYKRDTKQLQLVRAFVDACRK